MVTQNAERYSRQTRLPGFGEDGQERLSAASVLVVGAGGLGSPVLHLLAGAGVGTLGIAEFDVVDISNLHRQTLYSLEDVDSDKIDAAERRITSVNPDVRVVSHRGRLDETNALDLVSRYDVVVDGSDTFEARLAVNEASVASATPNVSASVVGFRGQVSVFGTESGPCYRCLYPNPVNDTASCDIGGVLGPVPSILGGIQATEVLKLLLGIGDPLVGRLMLVDTLSMSVQVFTVDRDPSCPTCGGLKRGRPTSPTGQHLSVRRISISQLRERLNGARPPVLLDVRESDERAQGHIGGVHIPLGQLSARLVDLERHRSDEIVVYCRSGARSAQAARQLSDAGFDTRSLDGGLDGWTRSLAS